MRACILFILAAAFLCGFRCALPWDNRESSNLTIISYNVHNLFDDVENGGEYPEFSLDSGKWNSQLYEKRLANAAKAIVSIFPEKEGMPDIICLQELESEKILTDLARGPLKGGGYRWIALGGPSDSAIKCGILSKHELRSLRAHSLVDAGGFGPSRDVLEATFALGKEEPLLTIFVCHWKSRREGEAETEKERRRASELVAARIAEIAALDPERAIVVCGDFNESPDEFLRTGHKYPTALMPDPRELLDGKDAQDGSIPAQWFQGVLRVAGNSSGASLADGEITLYSPWSGAEGFSYIFDGEKERLDGFLLGPSLVDGRGLEFTGFAVSGDPGLLGENGEPSPWNGSSGFSDHLPIALTIERGESK